MLLRRYPVRLSFLVLAALMATWCATPLTAQSSPSSQKVVATGMPAPLLPESFAGFDLQGKLDKATTPEMADAANAQVLTEDGFRDFASGTYKSNVNTVTIRAMRFGDASGAYAAYTFYRVPGTAPEDIGKGGAANGTRVL